MQFKKIVKHDKFGTQNWKSKAEPPKSIIDNKNGGK